jgi:hypothetical protein
MDRAWWNVHINDVRRVFQGELVTAQRQCHGVRHFRPQGIGNSGAGAIAVAADLGARRIVLLGYDCQHTSGKTHWHGDHPKGCAGNAAPKTMSRWPGHFHALASSLRGVEIINASRETALRVFPRMPLEKALT